MHDEFILRVLSKYWGAQKKSTESHCSNKDLHEDSGTWTHLGVHLNISRMGTNVGVWVYKCKHRAICDFVLCQYITQIYHFCWVSGKGFRPLFRKILTLYASPSSSAWGLLSRWKEKLITSFTLSLLFLVSNKKAVFENQQQ